MSILSPRRHTPDDLTTRILEVAEAARSRIRTQDRQRRHARLADQAMPMAVYYGPRPLRLVPHGQYLVEGWWAA